MGFQTEQGEDIALTPDGHAALSDFGIDLAALERAKAPLCRSCLDWSARRTHLAGSVGRAVLSQIEQRGWARRVPDTRIVVFSPAGEAALLQWLGAGR